jgi:IS5 family transposase
MSVTYADSAFRSAETEAKLRLRGIHDRLADRHCVGKSQKRPAVDYNIGRLVTLERMAAA